MGYRPGNDRKMFSPFSRWGKTGIRALKLLEPPLERISMRWLPSRGSFLKGLPVFIPFIVIANISCVDHPQEPVHAGAVTG